MSQTLTLELPDRVYEAVKEAAEATGCTPAEWIATNLPQLLPAHGEEPSRPEIPDEILAILQQIAPQMGKTTEELAAEWLARYGPKLCPQLSEEERQVAWERLRRHFGAVDLGYPTGADNESIDADLAREYGSTHEEEVS